MKCLLINLIVFVTVVNNSDTRKPLFLPQLPFGKYRLNFLGVTRCDSVQLNEKIKFQYYSSKKSANKTEIKGNVTNYVPIDDSLDLELNLAIKDAVSGLKENAYFYKSHNAYSTLKMFMGDAWIPVMQSAGIRNASCPVPVGFYEATGIDTDLFNTANFPKTLFYGTYRFRFSLIKKDKIYGCFIAIMEIKRPWESNN